VDAAQWRELAARVVQMRRLLNAVADGALDRDGFVPLDLLAARSELEQVSVVLAEAREACLSS